MRAGQGRLLTIGIVGVVVIVCAPLLLRLFVLEAFKLPSSSMAPTLLAGDHIFVDKLPFQSWNRGYVVIFKYPENTAQDFAKRMIAMPGETLLVKGGHPWINGWEVPHCSLGRGFLDDSLEPTTKHAGEVIMEFLGTEAYLVFLEDAPKGLGSGQEGPFLVKQGEVYVLGDNRMASHDSRFWANGLGRGVDKGLMKGRALFRWMPSSRAGTAVRTPLLPASMAGLQPGLDRCLAARPSLDKTIPPTL